MKSNFNILAIASEFVWFKYNLPTLSPKVYDIKFDNNFCYYSDFDNRENGKLKIDGILWREAHIKPDKNLEYLLHNIINEDIPCVNNPKVSLKCMDAVSVIKDCLNNNFLSQYCKFELTNINELNQSYPFVIKLPNYHSGLGKWLIKSENELEELIKNDISNSEIIIEPFLKGRDFRTYVYLTRQDNKYNYLTLERVAKKGEWLANKYTKSFRFINTSQEIKEICNEAVKLLNYPDLIAIDLIQNEELNILEIHNDVPGLYSLESVNNYSIHNALLTNLNILISKKSS